MKKTNKVSFFIEKDRAIFLYYVTFYTHTWSRILTPKCQSAEFQEALMERRRILEDANNLKKLANFFLHPEKPVQVDGTATARCYFDRPSAPERLSPEEAEEKAMTMEDLRALKQKSVDYMHPELPVKADAFACGRNYFTRPSAPEQEDPEEAEERARILADAKALKQKAIDYMHPEIPVVTSDPCACGRNYFSSYSAPEQEHPEEAEELARILADAKALKQKAVDYMHPELPVVATDPCACGRNYFNRYSAPEQDDQEEAEERARILAEAKALKRKAVDYMHPELPVVTTDPCACGRNYFDRYSAPEQEDVEEAEERARVLAEAKELKKLAVDYNHPELPVVTTDGCACGRNYFSRPSAPEQEDVEEAEERARVLSEAKQLKKLAVDYMHPELPVVTTDSFACGRNYFSRPSAPEYEDEEEAEERARILADCAVLKQKAVDYMHPELPVVTTDPYACGRNYFTRYSAPEQEDVDEAEERARLLADCQALKQKAVDYMHPELPVVSTDPFACGRNYFSRPSAPQQEDEEDAEERARILADCQALKQKAVDYMHPELPVVTTDPFACGRNYFTRYSAPEQEDHVNEEEHERILEDLKQLKKLAVDYLHPELPVVTTDPFACGRNYFTRYSAPDQEDSEEAEERARILADAKALKQKAVDYMHPELPAVTSDPCACGRNYFTRPSAPEQMDHEEAEEHARIIQEAKLFKKFAEHYMHPELPVTSDATATGRNYFSRYNATGHDAMIHTYPSHEHDEHHDDHHSHVEHWGMDEDLLFEDMRHTMVVPTHNKMAAGGEAEEGNLSRSPSNVMLFDGESIYD